MPLRSLPRLSLELENAAEFVHAELAFSLDEHERVRVCGEAVVAADVTCHRCSEPVRTQIAATIDAIIVRSDELAKDLAQETDVIVVAENPASVSELIEDDLMLSIPWRVCENEDECENVAAIGTANELVTTNRKPFANLRELLDDS